MHLLESLDASLFRFVNQSLSNPLFDWLMPFLSGNSFFVPVVIVAVVLMLWKGGVRGRVFVAVLAVTLWIGDGYVCKTIKSAVARPRPFSTLSDTRMPPKVGKTSSYSMPSSHAANWGAVTMVALIYFRRRGFWIAFPIALAVGVSRIYNGVHYPSDVVVGWILGAGYAAAIAWTLDALWRWAGRRWFPLWWPRLPSLLVPEWQGAPPAAGNADATSTEAARDRQWLCLGYLVIAALFVFRLWYIGSGRIDLQNDEAYQWLWSKHLALSYYSKPPMIAYTQFLGTWLWGDTEFGVRFFSPVITAVLSVMLLRFFAREASARLGFIVVMIGPATPLLAVGATLLTVDPLSVLFWTAAMLAGWGAVQPEGTTRQWIWVGIWMGFGFLSKYTSLFQILCGALFFAFWPPARVHLRRIGPYLALLINAVFMLPVLIWNAQHQWITVTHVGDLAEYDRGFKLKLNHVGDFLGAEFGLLNPVFFIGMVWACIGLWRVRPRDGRMVYFFSMSVPLCLVYFLQSFHASVLPNWIAPAVVPLLCLMALYWDRRRDEPLVRRNLVGGLIFGFITLAVLCETELVQKVIGRPVPVRLDPLHRVRGWKDLARVVGDAWRKLEAEGKPAFIITPHYTYTGQISFYLPEAKARVRGQPLVYYRQTAAPENQFFFWQPQYSYWLRKGDNAIFFAERDRPKWDNDSPPAPQPPPPELLKQFASVKSLGILSGGYKGRPIWWFELYECRDQR